MHHLVSAAALFTALAGTFAALAGTVAACGPDLPEEPDFGPAPAAAPSPSPARPGPGPSPASPAKFADDDGAINPRLLRRFKPLRTELEAAAAAGAAGAAGAAAAAGAAGAAGAARPPAARVDLGRMLFFDERLSRGGTLSCNSCHTLDRYGVDHEPTSIGFHGRRGTRNSLSVYQAADAFTNFWDGRALNVEEQAKEPLLNPLEMAMGSPGDVVALLEGIPGYVTAFALAFPDQRQPITYENVARAIGAFERGLVTPSRWDRFLGGDATALTAVERKGLKRFASLGCVSCHTGELLGGSSFQKAGVHEPWPNQADQGRFEVTGREEDRMSFRVPSLRNVTQTAPYFHDGSVADLPTAVRMMGRYQLGERLDPETVTVIIAWLGALTGELPRRYIARPTLPPSSVRTEAPASRRRDRATAPSRR